MGVERQDQGFGNAWSPSLGVCGPYSIVVVKDGRITEAGPYDVLMRTKKAFYQVIKDYSVKHKGKESTPKSRRTKCTHLSPKDSDILPNPSYRSSCLLRHLRHQ
jgi:hypothetical protein